MENKYCRSKWATCESGSAQVCGCAPEVLSMKERLVLQKLLARPWRKKCMLVEGIYYMLDCTHSTLAALIFTSKTRNHVKCDGNEHRRSCPTHFIRKMQMGSLTTRLHSPALSADSDSRGGKGQREVLVLYVDCRGVALWSSGLFPD